MSKNIKSSGFTPNPGPVCGEAKLAAPAQPPHQRLAYQIDRVRRFADDLDHLRARIQGQPIAVTDVPYRDADSFTLEEVLYSGPEALQSALTHCYEKLDELHRLLFAQT